MFNNLIKKKTSIPNERISAFAFKRYPYFQNKPDGLVGVCPVEIDESNGRVTVTITIEDTGYAGETGYISVTNGYEIIATCVYYELLRKISPKQINWVYLDPCDLGGLEHTSEVRMHWDGKRFTSPEWVNPKVVADYRLEDLSIRKGGIHLEFIDPGREAVTLPWSQFPRLKKATSEQLNRFSFHHHQTVIYWYELEEKLIVRDAILFGAGTVPRPSASDFIDNPNLKKS